MGWVRDPQALGRWHCGRNRRRRHSGCGTDGLSQAARSATRASSDGASATTETRRSKGSLLDADRGAPNPKPIAKRLRKSGEYGSMAEGAAQARASIARRSCPAARTGRGTGGLGAGLAGAIVIGGGTGTGYIVNNILLPMMPQESSTNKSPAEAGHSLA
jgi:hypothetical protein